MNASTTVKDTAQQFIWLLIFIGSVSAVTTLRRQLTISRSTTVTAFAQNVSARLLHTAAQTRILLLP